MIRIKPAFPQAEFGSPKGWDPSARGNAPDLVDSYIMSPERA